MSDAPPEEDPADAAIEEYLKLLDGGGEVDRTAFLAAHPEAAEALRSFFGSVSLLQQLAGPGGLAGTDTSGALTRPPRGLNFSDEDATDSRLPWTTLPAMFGRYRVESLLGRGAMGEVYRAHDTQLDRPVALKLSHFPRNTVLELRERLLQEARAAANLSHPNICRVYDVGEIDGTRFIAMELIEGRPLADYIRTNRLPPPKTAATLIRKLALALQMAHDKGIVHRDLKPTNVIVKADHEPILMDFGLAQRPVPIGGERLTKEGMLIGSPAYMSPEQARADGSTIGPTSDIYSLGVVLYELLTGQLPFTGSVMTILAKVLSEEPPMLHSIRPEIDRDLSDICRKMLAKRPEERFTSMNEVAEALQRWLKSAAKSSRELAVKTESTAKAGASASPAPLRKLTPGQVESLTLSARRCVKHHDYVQATKLLESIPYSQHSDESRSLLSKAQELGDEVELLIADMDQAVSLKQLETLPATLTRLLKLRPGYLPAKELLDRINSYGSGERRSFRFSQSGELLPGNPEEALFHGVGRMMLMLLLFGAVVFAGTSWYVWSYLLDPLRTVQVEIDDPTVTVVIDDQTVALSEGKGEVRLRSGSHGWTALKEGLPLKSAKFSVGKDHAGTLVIRLNSESQEVANPSSIVKEITSKTTGMKLALIPAGNFLMGSPATEELRSQDEGPQHSVQISKPFYMGIHEVTQSQFQLVMGHNPSLISKNGANSGRVVGMNTDQFPVENVSWFDAVDFCNKLSEKDGLPAYYKLAEGFREAGVIRSATVTMIGGKGYRLPTEGEWEYTCRANTVTPFHFGSSSNGREANVDGTVPYGTTNQGADSLTRTTNVGSYKQNAFGLFDMHGNVSEWCFDVYDDLLYKTRTGTTSDPVKHDGQMYRVLRGGSHFNYPVNARSAFRLRYHGGYIGHHVGFRVAQNSSETSPFNSASSASFAPAVRPIPPSTNTSSQPTVPPPKAYARATLYRVLLDAEEYLSWSRSEIAEIRGAFSGLRNDENARRRIMPLGEVQTESSTDTVQLLRHISSQNGLHHFGLIAPTGNTWRREHNCFVPRSAGKGTVALHRLTHAKTGLATYRLAPDVPKLRAAGLTDRGIVCHLFASSGLPTDTPAAPVRIPTESGANIPLRAYSGDPRFVPVYSIDIPNTLESWLTTEYWPLEMRAKAQQPQWESVSFQRLGYAYAKPQADARRLFNYTHLAEGRFSCLFDDKPKLGDLVRKDEWYPFNGYLPTKELPGTIPYHRIVHRENRKQLFWSREAWAKRTPDVNKYWIDRGYAFSLLKEPK